MSEKREQPTPNNKNLFVCSRGFWDALLVKRIRGRGGSPIVKGKGLGEMKDMRKQILRYILEIEFHNIKLGVHVIESDMLCQY